MNRRILIPLALIFHPLLGRASYRGSAPRASLPGAPARIGASPAGLGGIPHLQTLSGSFVLPPAASVYDHQAPLGRAAELPSALPAIPALAPIKGAAQGAAEQAVPLPGALEQASGLSEAVRGEDGVLPAGESADASLGAAFDGSGGRKDFSGSGGGNGGAGGGSNGGSQDDGRLGGLYPRVVFILDTLDGPASEKVVHHIEALADNGVRVVFVTPRPQKGPDSAESVLVSKLRRRVGNPVMVVSYNGSRITAHNSRAENPKPLVDDEPGFPAPTLERFRKVAAGVKAKLKIRGEFAEFGYPSLEEPFIYGAELPAGADAEAFARTYNTSLRNAGLKYKVEIGDGPDGRKYFFTQSTALRLNTGRIFKALFAQHPELRGSLRQEQVLVLADSRKASTFLRSLPQEESVSGKGYYIHGVTDQASLETALEAVLGPKSLEKISVLRSQLRAYTEWLEARQKYGPRSGGFHAASSTHARYYRDLGFYRGIIMYDIMGRLYHLMRKGQYQDATPDAALELLNKMWYQPRNNGVRISDEMEAARHSHKWKALQRGYLETSRQWLKNYYYRNFKDYPNGVSERVVGGLINLARDSKNSITLEYLAPYTGRRYTVHLLPARAHLERDDKGNLLVAHVYRTGKEPYEEEFEDSIETNLLARAMLEGYGDRRSDGLWYVNDEPNPRVKVVFHYMTRDLSRILTPAEVESQSADVTTLIEKMNVDKEFLAHWEEQEKKNNKITAGAAKRAASAATPKAARGKRKGS